MISVIIPFYNAIDFIEECFNSLSRHDIVSEIIVIYDGCPVTTFDQLVEILNKYNKLKIIHHFEFGNQGTSSSRNLGINIASNNWICFLDADDYILSNRFDVFKNFINSNCEFDGLYEPIQYFNGYNKIYGINKVIPPEKLFHYLLRGTFGHFHTNGLIVRKELLIKAGLFDKSLSLHQDSDLWIKLAFYGNLVCGDTRKPIAMVRKHEGNRIWKGASSSSRLKQWLVTWNWAKNENIGFINYFFILRKILKYKVGVLLRG